MTCRFGRPSASLHFFCQAFRGRFYTTAAGMLVEQAALFFHCACVFQRLARHAIRHWMAKVRVQGVINLDGCAVFFYEVRGHTASALGAL